MFLGRLQGRYTKLWEVRLKSRSVVEIGLLGKPLIPTFNTFMGQAKTDTLRVLLPTV